ncbi:hypothetical protein C8R47DRAFT_571693 [Mycena vitilis]|nr:hypothetical protein C8R47DRAFT_571693 [Mycena vitilis]
MLRQHVRLGNRCSARPRSSGILVSATARARRYRLEPSPACLSRGQLRVHEEDETGTLGMRKPALRLHLRLGQNAYFECTDRAAGAYSRIGPTASEAVPAPGCLSSLQMKKIRARGGRGGQRMTAWLCLAGRCPLRTQVYTTRHRLRADECGRRQRRTLRRRLRPRCRALSAQSGTSGARRTFFAYRKRRPTAHSPASSGQGGCARRVCGQWGERYPGAPHHQEPRLCAHRLRRRLGKFVERQVR